MSPVQSMHKFSLVVCLILGGTQLVHGTPVVFTAASFTVSYVQTVSGNTSVENYTQTFGISGGEFGNFSSTAYFPASVSYSGIPNYPGNQLDLEIPYNASAANAVSGVNFYGLSGGNITGTPPNSFGNFWASAGGWSPNLSAVQGPISATLNGGALDGYHATSSVDTTLLPTAPLLTDQSLGALGNITIDQAVVLNFLQPLSTIPPLASYSIYEVDAQNNHSLVSYSYLDLLPNPTGITIPPNTFLEGHNYVLSFADTSYFLNQSGSTDSYGASNHINFSVKSPGVPDAGSAVSMIGTALIGLAALRRRFAA
jgi:hypothetical protein